MDEFDTVNKTKDLVKYIFLVLPLVSHTASSIPNTLKGSGGF